MPKTTRMTSESLDIIHIKTTLSINEAAIYADIGEDKVRQLVHTKDFPCFKTVSYTHLTLPTILLV